MTSKIKHHDLTKHIIDYGISLGADQVEAYVIFGSVRSVQIERGSIRRFTDKSNSGLGIRLIKDKSIGMASTTIFSPDSIERTVKDAYALAKVSPPDQNFISLPNDVRQSHPVTDKFDKNISEMTIEDFTDILLESIQEASIRDDAVIGGNFAIGHGDRVIINSLGIERTSCQTSISGYLNVKLQDGDDVGNSSYYDAATTLKNFDHIKIGKTAGERAKKMLGSKKITTAVLPVLLDPESTYGTIASILANGINAFSVYNKTAFFIDKIGDKIASDKLNIIDDPFYPGGTDSASFDDEGVIPQKMILIKDGILQTYITDSYTAPLVNLENTGHASRGSFAARPTPAPYTLQIGNGDTSKDEMLEDMKEGILLISSSLNPIGRNPQISTQINQGFFVKDGDIVHPIKNAVIGSTVFDVYDKINVVSKETENRSGHIAPWMELLPLQISGGK